MEAAAQHCDRLIPLHTLASLYPEVHLQVRKKQVILNLKTNVGVVRITLISIVSSAL